MELFSQDLLNVIYALTALVTGLTAGIIAIIRAYYKARIELIRLTTKLSRSQDQLDLDL